MQLFSITNRNGIYYNPKDQRKKIKRGRNKIILDKNI